VNEVAKITELVNRKSSAYKLASEIADKLRGELRGYVGKPCSRDVVKDAKRLVECHLSSIPKDELRCEVVYNDVNHSLDIKFKGKDMLYKEKDVLTNYDKVEPAQPIFYERYKDLRSKHLKTLETIRKVASELYELEAQKQALDAITVEAYCVDALVVSAEYLSDDTLLDFSKLLLSTVFVNKEGKRCFIRSWSGRVTVVYDTCPKYYLGDVTTVDTSGDVATMLFSDFCENYSTEHGVYVVDALREILSQNGDVK